MNEQLRSIFVGTAGLSVALGLAVVFTTVRHPQWPAIASRSTARIAALAIVLQAVHFVEEVTTGFHQRFPALFGLAGWSVAFFVWFNLCWLAIWIGSLWALRAEYRAAFIPLWFLAIVSAVNGVAHPLLAAADGTYFPGLVTSPLVGVVGLSLLRHLVLVTAPRGRGSSPGLQ